MPSLVAANAAALAAVAGSDALTIAGILVWAGDLAIRAVRLLLPATRP